jgi:hypothetical protein
MRCDSCGKDIRGDEGVVETTNVPVRPPGQHGQGYTQTAPVWLCNDCAEYRRGNIRLLFWIIGLVLAIGAFIAVLNALL